MLIHSIYTILGEKANYYHYMYRKNKDKYQNITLSHRKLWFFCSRMFNSHQVHVAKVLLCLVLDVNIIGKLKCFSHFRVFLLLFYFSTVSIYV